MRNIKDSIREIFSAFSSKFNATGVTEPGFSGIAYNVGFMTVGTFIDFKASIDSAAGHHTFYFLMNNRSNTILDDLRIFKKVIPIAYKKTLNRDFVRIRHLFERFSGNLVYWSSKVVIDQEASLFDYPKVMIIQWNTKMDIALKKRNDAEKLIWFLLEFG